MSCHYFHLYLQTYPLKVEACSAYYNLSENKRSIIYKRKKLDSKEDFQSILKGYLKKKRAA
jgi:hypothetical protein